MKTKPVFIFLICSALACKDGGTLNAPSRSNPSGVTFNQALASSNFSNATGLTFSNYPANQFNSASNSNTFSFLFKNKACSPITSFVQVNSNLIEFGSAQCGEGVARWFNSSGQLTDIREFYYISASRTTDSRVEYLSFAFWGKQPKTGAYSFNELFFSEYTIFALRSDGSGNAIASYRGISGVITTDSNRGFSVKTDNLQMIELNDESIISIKLSIGCCSN